MKLKLSIIALLCPLHALAAANKTVVDEPVAPQMEAKKEKEKKPVEEPPYKFVVVQTETPIKLSSRLSMNMGMGLGAGKKLRSEPFNFHADHMSVGIGATYLLPEATFLKWLTNGVTFAETKYLTFTGIQTGVGHDETVAVQNLFVGTGIKQPLTGKWNLKISTLAGLTWTTGRHLVTSEKTPYQFGASFGLEGQAHYPIFEKTDAFAGAGMFTGTYSWGELQMGLSSYF